MDEVKLQAQINRGQRAEMLLREDLLIEGFEKLESEYISAWRASKAHATADREKLWMALNMVGKVREHLHSVLADGNVAKSDMKRLLLTEKERRRFWAA